MRLLHTDSGHITEFLHSDIPAYAILSHRWGDEEVTFQDMATANINSIKGRKGFDKIQKSCARAKLDGFAYIWIDTCCIDKTSSTELSESLNSMYLWYFRAEICYAYRKM